MGLLLETFLSMEYYRLDDFKMEEAKIYQYYERKLNSLYEKSIDKVLGENKVINSIYKENYTGLINLYELKVRDATDKMKLNKTVAENVSRQSEYETLIFLNAAFLAKENILVHHHNYNIIYPDISSAILDKIDFENILEYAKENSKEIYPLIALRYYVHKVVMIENFDENLMKFEKVYAEVRHTLDKEFHEAMLFTLNNAFSFKINHANTKEEQIFYASKSFNIYKFMDEEALFVQSDIFPTQIFKTIVTIGLLTLNTEWVLMFIEKYKHLLQEDVKDDTENQSLAEVYQAMENFEKSLYHYNQIKKPGYMMLWHIKVGLGVCHYELKNFETVLSLCDSTIVEIKRKYEANNLHDIWIEFSVRLRKLTKLRLDYSEKNLEDFEIFFKASRERYGKADWFDRKIREMKKLFENKKK